MPSAEHAPFRPSTIRPHLGKTHAGGSVFLDRGKTASLAGGLECARLGVYPLQVRGGRAPVSSTTPRQTRRSCYLRRRSGFRSLVFDFVDFLIFLREGIASIHCRTV